MRGLFVTGASQRSGKTIVCAALAHRLSRIIPVTYWSAPESSPIVDPSWDDIVSPPRRTGPTADVQQLMRRVRALDSSHALIVEGEGGVLAPVGPRELMADLMWWLRLPVILVSRAGVDFANHTLLSLEALKHRGIGVIGVVIVGAPGSEQIAAIERHGHVAVLALLPHFPQIDRESIHEWAEKDLDPRGLIERFVSP